MNSGASLPRRKKHLVCSMFVTGFPVVLGPFLPEAIFVFMSLDFNSGKRSKKGCLDPDCYSWTARCWSRKKPTPQLVCIEEGNLQTTRLDQASVTSFSGLGESRERCRQPKAHW